MARNCKKEYEWRKNKYSRFGAEIDKKIGDNLKKKLKEENKTIAGWITEQAKKYLDE